MFCFVRSLFRQAVVLLLQSQRKLSVFLVDEGVVKKKQIFSASQPYKHTGRHFSSPHTEILIYDLVYAGL